MPWTPAGLARHAAVYCQLRDCFGNRYERRFRVVVVNAHCGAVFVCHGVEFQVLGYEIADVLYG
jgi:hypothetical protein